MGGAFSTVYPLAHDEVAIDIKPGSDPNAINPNSRGVIPVAILTTSIAPCDVLNFDATTVDPLSVKFGPGQATESHGKGHIEDADGDGDLDLVLHFKTQQSGIQCGDTEASLVGTTFGGQEIAGTDAIQTVGCGSGKAFVENEDSLILPDRYVLSQNYPNPFLNGAKSRFAGNPETEIRYQLPEPTHVTIKIFNANGQEIRLLVDEEKQPGSYTVRWNGRNGFGKPTGSGLYFYTLRAGEFRETRKALLLR